MLHQLHFITYIVSFYTFMHSHAFIKNKIKINNKNKNIYAYKEKLPHIMHPHAFHKKYKNEKKKNLPTTCI